MNKTANYSLTIVIPVYNEEDNIKRLQEVVGAYLPACPVPVSYTHLTLPTNSRV